MHTGDRIKEERERLGFSQTDFAALVRATRKALFNWEKGSASPNAADLAVWGAHGLDVLYVVTGTRAAAHAALGNVRTATQVAAAAGGSAAEMAQTQAAAFEQLQAAGAGPALPTDEQMLLDAYRALDQAGKKALLQAALGVSPPGAVTQSNKGRDAVQIGHAQGVKIKR